MGSPNEIAKRQKITNSGNLDFWRGPYPTVADACAAILNVPDAEGLSLRAGKIAHIGTETNYVPHHWQGGYGDGNLLPSYKALTMGIMDAQATADSAVLAASAAQTTATAAKTKSDNIETDLPFTYQKKAESNFGGWFPNKEAANLAIPSVVLGGRNRRDGKIVLIGTGNSYVAYWWEGGFGDNHLIEYTNFGRKGIYPDLFPEEFVIPDKDGNVLFKVSSNKVEYIDQVTKLMYELLTENLEAFKSTPVFAKLFNLSPESFIIPDQDGNVLFKVDSESVSYINQVTKSMFDAVDSQVSILSSKLVDLYPGELVIADIDGNVIFRSNSSGIDYIGKNSGGSAGIIAKKGKYPSDFVLHIGSGQSLSKTGSNATITDYYDSLQFPGGVNADYLQSDSAAKAAYLGSVFTPLSATGAEYGKPLIKMVKTLILEENTIALLDQNFTWITASVGSSGASFSTLSLTSGDSYMRMLDVVRAGKDYAMALGKTFSVPVYTWMQGENSADKNDSIDTYFNKLTAHFAQVNTDIKAITGQIFDVQFITYQSGAFVGNSGGTGVPLAYEKAAREIANIHLGVSMYQMPYADLLHFTSAGARTAWAAMGVVSKRVIVDGEQWKHIQPLSKSITANQAGTKWLVSLLMHVPVEPLVFDETVNSRYDVAPTNKGFSILNGATEIITSVSISHGNTINIFCNQNPSGKTLTYAIKGRYQGGNLRDSQGSSIKVTSGDLSGRVDNWCPIFTYLI